MKTIIVAAGLLWFIVAQRVYAIDSVGVESRIDTAIADVLGREVSTIVNENLNTGTYVAKFEAANVASGIYYYRLKSGDNIQTKKMVLMK